MDVFECIKERKSTRKFKNLPVEQEKLEKIIEMAVNAPSGMNKQSWHFSVVSNSNWLRKINDRICSFASGSDIDRINGRNSSDTFSCNYFSPVLIIVSADPSLPTSEADCACALENIFLAATALGLGSCWINQLGKENTDKLRDILTEAGVPESNMVYGCAAIGYAENCPGKPARRTGIVNYLK